MITGSATDARDRAALVAEGRSAVDMAAESTVLPPDGGVVMDARGLQREPPCSTVCGTPVEPRNLCREELHTPEAQTLRDMTGSERASCTRRTVGCRET